MLHGQRRARHCLAAIVAAERPTGLQAVPTYVPTNDERASRGLRSWAESGSADITVTCFLDRLCRAGLVGAGAILLSSAVSALPDSR